MGATGGATVKAILLGKIPPVIERKMVPFIITLLLETIAIKLFVVSYRYL